MTPATTPPVSSTSISVTPHEIWHRSRGVLLAFLLLVVAATALAVARSGGQHGRLDPRSADRHGSRAIAELLKEHGISVRVVTTVHEAASATGPDTTLLVAAPNLLTPHQHRALRTATTGTTGRTVLLGADSLALATLAPGVRAKPGVPVVARPPYCSLPSARRAGAVETGGIRYDAEDLDVDAYYPAESLPSMLLVREPAASDTVLLGSPDFLYNERLDHQGNASLALQLLGPRPHPVWYLPSLTHPSTTGSTADDDGTTNGRSSFIELIPSGWLWGTLQPAVAAVLAAVWRARRLGPLVNERLPVARQSPRTSGRPTRLPRERGPHLRSAPPPRPPGQQEPRAHRRRLQLPRRGPRSPGSPALRDRQGRGRPHRSNWTPSGCSSHPA
ncbi:DUF4350 domain-containing protein [Streptomyces sp. NBC_00209]